jgi:hypothetical protein
MFFISIAEKKVASVATQKIVTALCLQELGTKLQLKSIAKYMQQF